MKAHQEIEIYEQISKQKAEEADRDRHEIPEFVYTLKGQTSAFADACFRSALNV